MLIALNEAGRVVGEGHHRAVLTDRQVDQLLEMRDEGFGYRRLSGIFEISKATVRRICAGAARCQTAASWREK